MLVQSVARNLILCDLLVVCVLLRRGGGTRATAIRALSALLLTSSMLLVFSLTGVSPLSGFHTDLRLSSVNLIPFKGMRQILHSRDFSYVFSNLSGNVLMFVPMGLFPPLLCPKLGKGLRTVLLSAAVSLLIECTQLFLARGTDVDDLLLNAFGGLLGLLAYRLARRLCPGLCGRAGPAPGSEGSALLCCCILVPYLATVLLGFYDRWIYFKL